MKAFLKNLWPDTRTVRPVFLKIVFLRKWNFEKIGYVALKKTWILDPLFQIMQNIP